MTGSWENRGCWYIFKEKKNLVLTQYASDGNQLTMEDLRQSLAESCDSLKLCKIRAAYYVENGEVAAECR